MLVQLLLVLYSANVEADNYAAYDKYSQGIVDHAGAAAQYHNTGNTEAASTPPRLFYNFRLLSPFFSLLPLSLCATRIIGPAILCATCIGTR